MQPIENSDLLAVAAKVRDMLEGVVNAA